MGGGVFISTAYSRVFALEILLKMIFRAKRWARLERKEGKTAFRER